MSNKTVFPAIIRVFGIAMAFCVLSAVLFSAPDSSQNPIEMGRTAESQGYFNLAAHYYSHAVKQDPDNVDLEIALARVLQKSGHLNLAETHWLRVLELHLDDETATSQLALLHDPVSRKALEDAATGLSVIDAGPKTSIPLEKGEAAWVSGDPREISKVINEYNLGAPHSQRVKYVFPACGNLAFKDGRAILSWDLGNALVLADTLAGEGRVYPVISGSSNEADSLGRAEWERVAKEIAAKINADDRISGIVFEIAPEKPVLRNLFAFVKKNSDKPLGAALQIWEKEDFLYADFLVLRSEDSLSGARDQIHAFLSDARDETCTAIVSFPGGADTFSNRRDLLINAMVDNDPSLLGMAVTLPTDQKIWDLLKVPLQ
jgi:hypothetical protein